MERAGTPNANSLAVLYPSPTKYPEKTDKNITALCAELKKKTLGCCRVSHSELMSLFIFWWEQKNRTEMSFQDKANVFEWGSMNTFSACCGCVLYVKVRGAITTLLAEQQQRSEGDVPPLFKMQCAVCASSSGHFPLLSVSAKHWMQGTSSCSAPDIYQLRELPPPAVSMSQAWCLPYDYRSHVSGIRWIRNERKTGCGAREWEIKLDRDG